MISNTVYTVEAIGYAHNTRKNIEDDNWDEFITTITVDPNIVGPNSLVGLDGFSHVEIVYLFNHVQPNSIVRDLRHPRDNTSWPKVGIFSQRAKNRPNRIGLSTAEIISVSGDTLTIRGLDAIDGTPILDIKPYMVEFSPRTPQWQPQWATGLMHKYFR